MFLQFLGSCHQNAEMVDALQKENNQLKERLNQLENRTKAFDFLQNHSEVVLPNTELKTLKAPLINQAYKIKIKLPRGYEEGSQSYPVLYVTDAETNFGGISYIVDRLTKDKLIPAMIVVGIAYGTDYDTFYKLRSRDLTPVVDKNLRLGGKKIQDPTGGADKFVNFISNRLMPFIKQQYRVTGDKAIYGHSYGGLFSSYVLLKAPSLFNKYLILSPSLWFKKNVMINMLDTSKISTSPKRIYMASGELEGRIDDLQINFANKLKKKGLSNIFIKDEVMENETHRTIFGPGFTNGLRFLYADEINTNE